MRLAWELLQSPIGTVLVAGHDTALVGTTFLEEPLPRGSLLAPPPKGWPAALKNVELCPGSVLGGAARAQLEAWFAGDRIGFDLPLELYGTPYQKRVWAELQRVPFGETRTYGQIAARIERTSPRAVGMANHRNPLPVVIPCHRVIGADRSLVGFGAGLERKRWLLDHEAGQRQLRLPT